MKKLVLLLFVVSLSSFAQNADQKPYMVKKFDAKDIKMVLVQTSGGGIKVEGGHEDEARVEVYVSGNGWFGSVDEDEIKERLNDYILKVEKSGNALNCIAKRKESNSSWTNGLSIAFKVYVPKNVDTKIGTSGGGIRMTNLTGDLKFNTSGGGLTLANLSGKIDGTTSGGGISCTSCTDQVKLSTSGGGITFKNSFGTINLSTSGGGIKLEDLKGKVSASTSGGSVNAVRVNGSLNTSTSGGSINLDDVAGNIKASTSGGGITAHILKIDEHLSLSTSAGNIRVNIPLKNGLDFDVQANKIEHNLSSFVGENEKDELVGKYKGGGAKVKLHAGSGKVVINED